jgi:chemotaxis protein methyltransferase CheR
MPIDPLRQPDPDLADGPTHGQPGAGPSGIVAPRMLDRELTASEFGRISRLLYNVCGIRLQPGKEPLVKARLWKRIASLGLKGYEDYLAVVESRAGAEELSVMVDALTTNKTSFFREPQHFEFLRQRLRTDYRNERGLRIWCAGCSTGQEPYTLAITLLEEWPDAARRDARILATDISARVLESAREGQYTDDDLTGVEVGVRRRHFAESRCGEERTYRVADGPRALVKFARLNLLGPWPMRGPFDFIFCRNVMIYFDKETQLRLSTRFADILRPDGYLVVGHSESLTGRVDAFTYIIPAVYRKTKPGYRG